MDPRRRPNTMRLRGHDYASSAAYYVTVCVDDREPLFGEVVNDRMNHSVAGLMIES